MTPGTCPICGDDLEFCPEAQGTLKTARRRPKK